MTVPWLLAAPDTIPDWLWARDLPGTSAPPPSTDPQAPAPLPSAPVNDQPSAPSEYTTSTPTTAWYEVSPHDDAVEVVVEADHGVDVIVREKSTGTVVGSGSTSTSGGGTTKVSYKPKAGETYTVEVKPKDGGQTGTVKVVTKRAVLPWRVGAWAL